MESPPVVDLSSADSKQVEVDLSFLAIVTVSYNPDPEILGRQLSQLPPTALTVVVETASHPSIRAAVVSILAGPGAVLREPEPTLGMLGTGSVRRRGGST